VVVPTLQPGIPNPQSGLHPWAPNPGSRHPVEAGAEAQGMEAPPRGGGEYIQREFGQAEVDLFTSQETHWLLWFSLTHSGQLGMDAGADVFQAFPPIDLHREF